MRVAVITASTPIYRGQEEDASGKVIRHILEDTISYFNKHFHVTRLYFLQ